MILGITGSVGTGKSTVSRMFEKKGAYRIDADRLSHEAIGRGERPYRAVVRTFGNTILRKDGSIHRQKLARLVFRAPGKLEQLNRIVHPYVVRRMKEEIRINRGRKAASVVVAEVPLLFEARLERLFDRVLTVVCRPAVQKARWRRKGGTAADFAERRARQLPLSYKRKRSDFVVENSGSRRRSQRQVDGIWEVVMRACAKRNRKGKRIWLKKR